MEGLSLSFDAEALEMNRSRSTAQSKTEIEASIVCLKSVIFSS